MATAPAPIAPRPISPLDAGRCDERSGDFGAAPMLTWVKVSDLIIDPAYQRPIGVDGRRNIRAIVREFAWARFAPLILASAPGGKFAVIDGQHRATAAHVLGIEQLPAQVVIAEAAAQALAFKSINGRVTRVSPLALHAAAVAAGEPEALEIDGIVKCAGVEIVRYPIAASMLVAGQTLALGAIKRGVNICGRDGVITALQCVTLTENNQPGALRAATISALCRLLVDEELREAGERLMSAFDAIDLEDELDRAAGSAHAQRRTTVEILTESLRARVRATIKGKGQVAA